MSRSLQPRSRGQVNSSLPVASTGLAPAQQSAVGTMLQQFRVRRRVPFGTVVASFTSAGEAIWGNRTRSFLTMLGIFIGVAAVIAALTLTQSAGAFFLNLVAGLGSNTVIIQNGSTTMSRGAVLKRATRSLTMQDLQSVERLPHVIAISPFIQQLSAQAIYAGQNWKAGIAGVTSDYEKIQDWPMADGVWFSDSDENGAQSVAVIGDTVVQNLFNGSGSDAIGKNIRVNGQTFRVVGVLSAKGGGFGQDNVIFVPFNTARLRFGANGLHPLDGIYLQIDSSDNVDVTVQEITAALEQNHHLRQGQPDDFQLTTSAELLKQSQQAIGFITILLVGIAAISLTVGGIGIMNIMLVSVTQRTREIGIRMSIGARRRDIRNQFLIEALVLCLIGGGLGLLGGIGAGYAMTSGFGIPPIVTTMTVVLPFAVSTAIALVFGIYPASRAARLDPVVALRSGAK